MGEDPRAVVISEELHNEALRIGFEGIRQAFLQAHGDDIMKGLESEFGHVQLYPAPVSEMVKERFMQVQRELPHCELRPAFHGTNRANHPSIFKHGLLIPGDGNELKIEHGAAHGRGVYTANIDAAWLSREFCTAPVMLICGVLQTDSVRHIFDAMVVGKSEHVIPLFVGQQQTQVCDQLRLNYCPTMVSATQVGATSKVPKNTTNLPKGADSQEKKAQKSSKFKAQVARKATPH